jgi:hypothetical protein
MALNSNSSRIAGGTVVSVNGKTIPNKGNVVVKMGVGKRTAIVGEDGIHGYSEASSVPGIEFTASNRNDLDLKALLSTDGATVVAQIPNGKTYTLRDAWAAAENDVNLSEGELKLMFEGLSIEEV